MSEILQSEEMKLYEYNQYKPELEDQYIEHFGILGMHWGQRNGPPYPLSRVISTGRKLKAAAKAGSVKRKRKKALKKARITRAQNAKIRTFNEEMKEKIIKSKDIKSMLSNVDKFTNKEILDMLDRLNVEQRLKEAVSRQEDAKKSWVKKTGENIRDNIKTEVPKTLGEMARTATNRGVKLAGNRVLKELVGPESVNKYGDKWQEVIDKLVPDPMGGGGQNQGKKKKKKK